MSQSDIRTRLIVVAVVVVVCLFFLTGTFRYLNFALNTPVPPKEDATELAKYSTDRNTLLKKSIRFGLDLMGGVDVLLSIDQDQLLRDHLDEYRRQITAAFRQVPIVGTVRVNLDRKAIEVSLGDKSLASEALTILKRPEFAGAFETIEEAALLNDGRVTLVARTDQIHREALSAVDRTRDLLRERVDSLGLVQPSVAVQGTSRIRVQLPGETDPEGTVAQVIRPAYLDFRLVHAEWPSMLVGNKVSDEARARLANDPRWVVRPGKISRELKDGTMETTDMEYVVEAHPSIEGEDIARAQPYSVPPAQWEISLEFKKQGVTKMAQLTSDNPQRLMAILLDGVVRSSPLIKEPILNGRCSIEGTFTMAEAIQLSQIISTGALPVKLRTESSQVIGAQLGTDAIKSSLMALAIGGALIVVFMIAYYSGSGFLAIAALLINIIAIMALLAGFEGTLTVSGIAGILLTLGMAVDANVLIYERIREELAAGRRPADAIGLGFQNAFSTIIDSNLTTLITALILLQFGKGSVQGFALTMTFGIFATLFTGLYVSRALFGWTFERHNTVSIGKARLFKNPDFNIVGISKFGFLVSAIVLAIGLFSVVQHGGLIPGADFAGGMIAEVRFPGSATLGTSDVRDALGGADPRLKGVNVVRVVSGDSFIIKTRLLGEGQGAVDETSGAVEAALSKAFPGAHEIVAKDEIGHEVSGDFLTRAIVACVFACIGILIYVAFRFEWRFGVAAVAALIHDTLITLVVITMLDIEITLDVVAAVLMVIGYSINDTIVIFDRIRELLGTHLRDPLPKIANMAVNQCMNRTIITSFTALLAVVSLMVWGGQGVRDFSITLFVGFLAGIYSTVFLATPVLLWLARRREQLETAKAGA